jgi:TetR/AcrR family transcriptional repressor of nem operon
LHRRGGGRQLERVLGNCVALEHLNHGRPPASPGRGGRLHALGYSACGVQEIVDAAGVPKGSFYNYFKAKELLAVEVLGMYWDGVRIDTLADKSVVPVERIRGHFEHIASLYAGFGYERGCLIGKFVQELSETTPRIRQDVVSGVVRWIGLLASTIREGQAGGSIARELDADKIARFMINSRGAPRRA